MLLDDLDKAVTDYAEVIGEFPKLIWLCDKHFVQLNLEQRTWSAANRYGHGIAVGCTLNGEVRCLVCGTGIYVNEYPAIVEAHNEID